MNIRAIGNGMVVATGALMATGMGAGLQAQYLGGGTKTPTETRMADVEEMGEKFMALGDAFPQGLYGWQPMEGVRSPGHEEVSHPFVEVNEGTGSTPARMP